MSEFRGRSFLRTLFHAVRRYQLSAGGPNPRELADLKQAAELAASGTAETVLTIEGDAFFLGERMLQHASVEFNGLLRGMQEREIDSVTLLDGVSTDDLGHFACVIAGKTDEPATRGGVRVNERPLPQWRLHRLATLDVREAYSNALDTLRRFGGGLALDLGAAFRAVDRFVGGSEATRRASLLLAGVHNLDEVVAYHSVNVCLLSLALGDRIGLTEEQQQMLGVGALLHDVGRIARADGISEQDDRLTTEDWSAIRMHPQEGAAAILAATRPGDEVLARVALEHHLRLDGGGYPELPGVTPHLYARIVSITDVYEAIVSDRPHRPGRTPSEALAIIRGGAGEAHDPELVDAFLNMMGTHPPGSLVRLPGGEIAMVIPADPGRLEAVVIQNAAGEDIHDGERFALDPGRIADLVTPTAVGIDPAALLEQVADAVPVH